MIMIPLASITAKVLGKRMGKVVTEAQEKSGDLNRYLIDLFKNHKIIKFSKERILKKKDLKNLLMILRRKQSKLLQSILDLHQLWNF